MKSYGEQDSMSGIIRRFGMMLGVHRGVQQVGARATLCINLVEDIITATILRISIAILVVCWQFEKVDKAGS